MSLARGHLEELEGLRGLLALWVVVGHWGITVLPAGPIDPHFHNSAAVEIFILLSGFVIARLIDFRPEPWRHYIARRASRIIPVYLIFLALSALIAPAVPAVLLTAPDTPFRLVRLGIAQDGLDYFWPHLLVHATALHGLVPRDVLPSTAFALIGQAWSLSLEWQFYLVAPLLVGACRGFSPFRIFLALAFLVAAVGVGKLVAMSPAYLGRHLPFFLIGIASHFLHSTLMSNHRFAARARPWLRLCLVLFGLSALFGETRGLPLAIWLGVLLVITPFESVMGRYLRDILGAAPLRHLGRIAYPVYLGHMVAMLGALALMSAMGAQPRGFGALLLLGLTLAFTLPLAWLVHVHVEAPCHHWGRRILRQDQDEIDPAEKSGASSRPRSPSKASAHLSPLRHSAMWWRSARRPGQG